MPYTSLTYPIEIVHSILSMKNFAVNLIGRGKDYDDLLNLILNLDYDRNILRHVKVKDLQDRLNISYSVLMRQLKAIYKDLLEHDKYDIEFSIKNVEYIFSISQFNRTCRFVINNLPCIPRLGEVVNIPFTKYEMGYVEYYVDRIENLLSDTKQSIIIHLKAGYPNLYF